MDDDLAGVSPLLFGQVDEDVQVRFTQQFVEHCAMHILQR